MSAFHTTRTHKPDTGEQWRALGFYHELDTEGRTWRFIGSPAGLRTLARMLAEYADEAARSDNPPTPLEIGPYHDLKVRVWERPGIDDESIHGPEPQLRRLAQLIESRLAQTQSGSTVEIGTEYEANVEYSLHFEIMDEKFDPATVVPVVVADPDGGSAISAAPSAFDSPSIPFSFEDPDEHFSENEGLARIEGTALLLEYETKSVFPFVPKSGVNEIELRLDGISAVRFKRGMFGAKIVVQARDMKSVERVPGAKHGRMTLKFKRAHREDAAELAAVLEGYLGGG